MPTGHIVFVDGSCYSDQSTGLWHTGAAVVEVCQDSFSIVSQRALPNFCFAQTAELTAVISALTDFPDTCLTIYSDSAYVCSTVHINASVWELRGFVKSDGSPVQHKHLLRQLLTAVSFPSQLAVVKCAAHTGGTDMISKGNHIADLAAVPNLTEHVSYFLHNCAICQTYTPSPTQNVVIATIPRPLRPFLHLHIDFIDMTERYQR